MTQRTEPPDPVDALVLEYLRATEAGEPVDIEELAGRLPDPHQRTELKELLSTASWARATFPAPLRPQLLVAGRYRLLQHIGSGGFGRVWRAHDEKLDREVALKLFHALMDGEEVEAALRRERLALAAVRHEGIVRLLDSGVHDGTQFLVMELVRGVPVDHVVAELGAEGAAFPPPRAAVEALVDNVVPGERSLVEDDWFRTVANVVVDALWALAAAHARGVVHRDLKPGNVMLRGGARPVVLDFGLAGLTGGQGALTGQLFGTAAYIAPEQIEQQRMGKEAQTDVYQCGLVLYELLTLRRAFGSDDRSRLLTAVREGAIAAPRALRPAIPRELEDVCLRAIARSAAQRYATADEFRADLERWLAGETPLAARLGVAGRVVRRGRATARRHRTMFAAAAALVLGGAATAFLVWRPEAVGVLAMEGNRLTLQVASESYVLVLETRVGKDATTVVPMQVTGVDGSRTYVALLPAGTQKVDVQRPLAQPGAGERVEVRAVPVASDQVNDWNVQLAGMAEVHAQTGRPLDVGAAERVQAELGAATRGDAANGIRALDLRVLFPH